MKSIKVTITAEFGSSWQAEIQGNTLQMMLKAWQMAMENGHKKNLSIIKIVKEK